MDAQRRELEEQYTGALLAYIADRSETALEQAYELGRAAINQRLGLLDVAVLFQKGLEKISARIEKPEECADVLGAAASFLIESLGAFEMVHRGFHETNTALLKLNERLEEEAKRIAHALHDESGQLLACVHIALAEIDRDLPPDQRAGLQKVREFLDEIEEKLRRLSHELRPTILDDLGLVPALEFLAEGVSKRVGLSVSVEGPREGRLPFLVETSLYRIVQEALTNITRHAQATRACVRVLNEPRSIHCSVKDDGGGFDLTAVAARKGDRGLGLIGIRERVEALGGKLSITSEPGKGTELSVTIPLPEA